MGFFDNIKTNTGANIDNLIYLDSNFFNSQTIGTVIKVQTNNGLVSYKKNEKNHWIKEKPKFIEKPTSETVIAPFSPDLKLPFKSVDNKNYYILLKDLKDQFFNDLDPFNDGKQVAYYKLDNSVLDSMGSYNGTNNNVTFNNGVAVFNGSNANISTAFKMGTQTQYTFCLSFKTSIKNKNSNIIGDFNITNGANASARGVISFFNSNIYVSMGDGTNYSYDTSFSIENYLNGSWQHLSLVFDGKSQKLYLNGNFIKEYTLTVSAGTAGAYNYIIGGAVSSGTNYHYQGELKRVRFFARALTQEEVTTIYNKDK